MEKAKRFMVLHNQKEAYMTLICFKKAYRGIHERIKIQADSGYQGIKGIHINSKTPKKSK